MKMPLCTAAHTALLIDVDKGVRPCCAYEGNHMPGSQSVASLGDVTLSEILGGLVWSGVRDQLARREVPPACLHCIEREKRVGSSQRLAMLNRQSPNWHKVITYLELNSSNLCNLQCRHCSPTFSSRWAKHAQRRGDTHAKVVFPDGELILRNLQSVDLQHLDYVAIKGGEPMLNSDVLVLLRHLDSIGVFKNITLHLVTNGTVINPAILDLMRRARSCQICLSIDGVGPVQTYIRHGGSEIEQIEEAIAVYAAMPNVQLSRNTSVMAYNIFRLDAIDDWWSGLATRFPGNYCGSGYALFVLWPEALAVDCLQDHTRKALAERYRTINPKLYGPVIRVLEQPFAGAERHDEFVRRTLQTDRELGRSYLDAVPELAEEMVPLGPEAPEVLPRLRAAKWTVQEIEARVAGAWDAVNRGDWQFAETQSAAVYQVLDGSNPYLEVAALHVQSVAAALSGQVSRGLEILSVAIAKAPGNLVLRLHRGRMLEQLGQPIAACDDARSALVDVGLAAEALQLLQRCGRGD